LRIIEIYQSIVGAPFSSIDQSGQGIGLSRIDSLTNKVTHDSQYCSLPVSAVKLSSRNIGVDVSRRLGLSNFGVSKTERSDNFSQRSQTPVREPTVEVVKHDGMLHLPSVKLALTPL
jgi:hypothetical protein